MLAAWSKDVMKAGQAHALPIPKRAWAVIDALREKNRNADSQEWAFPSEKGRGEIACTQSGVYGILARLANRKKPEDSRAKPVEELKRGRYKQRARTEARDLFAENSIDWWTPHDLRRAITTAMDEAGIPGGASVILAHDIHEKEALGTTKSEREREDFQRLRTARVTKMAYGGAQYIKLKKEGMKVWTNVILDEYEQQKAAKSAILEAAE